MDKIDEQQQQDGTTDCQAVFESLQLLLDGECSPEREQELIDHINSCPQCLTVHDIDKSFKDLIVAKVEKKGCSESLKAIIRNKINSLQE